MKRWSLGFLVCALAAGGSAFAGKTVLIPLEDDCEPVQRVVEAEVEDVTATEKRMTLADGSPGPVLEWHYEYRCRDVQVRVGEPISETKWLFVQYSLTTTTKYDGQGKALATESPIRSGSGLEPRLEQGARYLLLLSAGDASAGPHLLHRAELPERLDAVREAMARATCWRALRRGAGIARESAHSVAWDAGTGVFYVSVARGEERDVYRVERESGAIGKAMLAGAAAQFDRLVAQNDGVLLMPAGYEPHGKTVARMLRPGDFQAVGEQGAGK